MKRFLNGLYTYLTFAALYAYCNAGLLDIILRRNIQQPQPQQIFNVNNNPRMTNPFVQTIKNLATRDKYNARNNNWGPPVAFHMDSNKHSSHSVTNDIRTSDSSDDESRIPHPIIQIGPTNVAQNTNPQRVGDVVSGLPFINDNSGLNRPLGNQFPGNDASLNPRINSVNPLINRPITNGNVGNIHNIMQDIKKINNIMDQIKQKSTNNQGNLDPSILTNNGNTNFDHSTGTNFPIVHINNGLEGLHTNLHNDNTYPTSNILNNIHRNPETNLNTAVTNAQIVTPPPGILMTNLPKENHNKPPSSSPISNTNMNKIDDKDVLKPITKRKFFSQVRPIVPEYRVHPNNETIYYID